MNPFFPILFFITPPRVAVVCVLAGAFSLPAAAPKDSLAGDLPATVEAGIYRVLGDIYVPAGKTVSIEEGTVFLFNNFTGLHVEGVMLAHGTRRDPIIFTSANDRTYAADTMLVANPYDWNGISVHEDAVGTTMEHFTVTYSVYGIHSLTKYIRLVDGTFRYNGRGDFFVNEEQQTIVSQPYSYSLSVRDVSDEGVPIRILQDPAARKRTWTRYGGLALTLGGAAFGAWHTFKWFEAEQERKKIDGDLFTYSSTDHVQAVNNRRKNMYLLVGGYAAGAAGVLGFGWSFAF